MTMNTEITRVAYTCNGIITSYAYPFKVLADADLLVIKKVTATLAETTLTLNADYTVTGAGSSAGTVVLTAGSKCGAGCTLTILRNIAATQGTDYVDGEAFSAESIENALDKVAMIQQQIKEAIGRAPLLKKSAVISGLTLPDPEGSKYIGWNSSATNLENKSSSPTQTTVGATNVKYLSNYANFATAIATIGSTATTLVVDTTANVSVNTTTPTTLQIGCEKIGSFVISTGVTLTINGFFSAGKYQCFSCSGTGKVVLPYATLYPEWWGALGDGATDDSFALSKMAAAISGGATLEYSAGKTYIFNNTTYSVTIFDGLTNLVFNGNRAILKIKDGSDQSYAWGLYFKNCSDITIKDLQLDGNRANVPQVAADGAAYGIFVYDGNSNITITNCNIYDFATDSIQIGNATLSGAQPRNILVDNVRAYRARRNNISISGALDVTVRNSQILSAGVDVGTSLGRPPKAGVDLEPDLFDVSHCNDRITFENNYIQGNVTNQFSGQGNGGSYNVSVKDNKITVDGGSGILVGGSVNRWWNITGNIINLVTGGSEAISATTPVIATDILINNNQIHTVIASTLLDVQDTGKRRWSISNNTFSGPAILLYVTMTGATVDDLLVSGNKYYSIGDDQADDDFVTTINDGIVKGETFVRPASMKKIAFTSGSELPLEGYVVVGATGGATAIFSYAVITSGSWAGGNAAGTFYAHSQTGNFGAENINIQGGTSNVMTVSSDTSALANHYRYRLGGTSIASDITTVGALAVIFDLSSNYALPGSLINRTASQILEFYGTAAPASGTWAVGAIVRNTVPAASGNIGWVCTTGGTPGTWKTYGAIAAP